MVQTTVLQALSRCNEYLQNRDLDSAEKLLSKITKAGVLDATSLLLHSTLEFKKGNVQSAIKYLYQSNQQSRPPLKAALNFAYAQIHMGGYKNAHDFLNTIERHHNSTELLEVHKLITHLNAVHPQVEFDKHQQNQLISRINAQKNSFEKVKVILYAEANFTKSVLFFLLKAQFLFEFELYADVLIVIERIKKLGRLPEDCKILRIQCLRRFGDVNRAHREGLEVLQVSPQNTTILFECALVEAALSRTTEAAELYKKIISIDKRHLSANFNLGNIYKSLKKYDLAKEHYKRCIDIAPFNTAAMNNLGNIYLNQKNFSMALRTYKRAQKIMPTDQLAYLNEAHLLSFQGETAKAIALVNQILTINPNFIPAISFNAMLLAQLRSRADEYYELVSNSHETASEDAKFLLSQLIVNFCHMDFSSVPLVLQNIRRAQLMPAYSQYSNQDKILCGAYTNFIDKLYNALPSLNDYENSEKFFHFGDSHSLTFCGHKLEIKEVSRVVQAVPIIGAKAYHFAQSEMNTYKAITLSNLHTLDKESHLLLSFGEIDCRLDEGFVTRAGRNSGIPTALVTDTARKYLAWFRKNIEKYGHLIHVIGVPAPIYQSNYSELENKRRLEIIRCFNDTLLKECDQFEIVFVDLFGVTASKSGFSNKVFHCDEVHLSPKIIPYFPRLAF